MDELSYTILPVDMEDREDLYLDVEPWCVQRDKYEWILRFRMGERVLCYTGRWEAATVVQLWPDPRKGCYLCRETTVSGIGADHLVPEDTDKYIIKLPLKFRFSKGDQVIFSSGKAVGIKNTSLEPWIRGKITRVDIVGLRDHYAVYECSFMDRNKTKKCFILKDNDEHVASSNASPRQRLLEAIEQDCAYQHIDFLVKSFLTWMSMLFGIYSWPRRLRVVAIPRYCGYKRIQRWICKESAIHKVMASFIRLPSLPMPNASFIGQPRKRFPWAMGHASLS